LILASGSHLLITFSQGRYEGGREQSQLGQTLRRFGHAARAEGDKGTAPRGIQPVALRHEFRVVHLGQHGLEFRRSGVLLRQGGSDGDAEEAVEFGGCREEPCLDPDGAVLQPQAGVASSSRAPS
jgi:hypothetical protein